MPQRSVEMLAGALDSNKATLSSSSVGLTQVRGLSDESAARVAKTFARLRETSDAGAVASALRVGNRLRSLERLSRPDVEIAWTGPNASGPLIRSTSGVLEEMLEGTRDSGEILLVGYVLTASKGSFMERVVDLLQDAARRHASIVVVLHDDDGSKNIMTLLDLWDVFTKKPRVYTWRPPAGHPYSKLHAKCLVVDRLDGLVTSANFTFHGLESNLELGLRVRGRPAGLIAEQFDHLIGQRVLVPWG